MNLMSVLSSVAGECVLMYREFIREAAFRPSFWGLFVNPFWLARRELYSRILHYSPLLRGKILDFGAGSSPYKRLLSCATDYVSLEYDTPCNRNHKKADLFYDGARIPVDASSFDVVLSTQTLEHVPNPQEIVNEWRRVLRSGGCLLLTVPFVWPEHEMPYDFQRYTTNGVKLLLVDNGFEVVAQERLLRGGKGLVQLCIAVIYGFIHYEKRSRIFRGFICLLLFAPFSLLAILVSKILPESSQFYLDNLVLARKL